MEQRPPLTGVNGPAMETVQAEPGWERAGVTYVEGMHFAGEADGMRVDLDAGEDAGGSGAGARPMRLVLLSLAGCTVMDVLSILRKKRQQVSGLRVDVEGQQVDQHQRVYNQIVLIYRVRGTNSTPPGGRTRDRAVGDAELFCDGDDRRRGRDHEPVRDRGSSVTVAAGEDRLENGMTSTAAGTGCRTVKRRPNIIVA